MKKSATEVSLTQAQLAAACGISQPQASRDLRAAGIGLFAA
jgi:predicted transcriptional regulator